jgi:hypothetical protein
MPLATLLIVLLIVTIPASLILDGPITHGLIVAAAAALVAIVALRLRPGGAGFLATVIRPLALLAAIPALWMFAQIMPLGALGLAHPIWGSAAEALGRPIVGSISINPGATLVALARYLSTFAVAFVAAAVAVDRYRAGWILFALTASTTLIALFLLALSLGEITFLSNSNNALAIGDRAAECSALGVIVAAAAALHILERSQADQSGALVWYRPTIVACLAAFILCSAAVIMGATNQACFAVACGVATLAAAIFIRRFSPGPWGLAAIVSVVLVVVIAAIVLQPDSQKVGLLLEFATRAPPQMIALTHSILADRNWVGTGAGTFAAVLPIYRNIDQLETGLVPPSAVAAIAIELGRPFLLASLIAAIVSVTAFLRSAVRRGRDAIFPMAGASCLVTATLFAFCNSALLSTPVSVITATIIGIAVAQSKSRSVR